ncbi:MULTISPECIES: transglycosylase domain-containing protein [Rhizobium/Agrobacterium group]|uniref:Putative penicillin-binding protein (MrcA-like) n=1 Tax=Agrobacterium tomkonis CFBP 6623 TaxID=1183432 RepID=A0A1S7PW81_9HYPH|nr:MULTISPECIES: transglycosylase domain-containing protein [Rhizobium/Agrobacterium group]MCA2379934.1 penicillin-binding protein [Agrobacterium tomkonis RTP8]KRA62794.1 penicillin-binding protein [Rhizobium sp. Root651]MCZ7452783.1 transglycosylase domain-containing protein [Rhizobium rhizogenes]QCL88233.1 penicillin-binding protein [Agrobacterium tumefaciens]TKT67716.1 penicillin-binding protein [Agrobacterium sp. LC34]
MQEEKDDKNGRKKRHILLRIDSFIDSGLWTAAARLVDFWEDVTIASRKLHVRGWKKLVVNLTCDALTFGTAGAVVLLALAMPAFEETKKDWRYRGDFAVTFLDRYGNTIGHRGIIHEDSVPIDQMPDHFIKAVLATEDRRFFDHFGIDFIGLARAMSENARAGGVVQGGSTLTQQLAKNLFLTNERSLERKIKEAFLALWLESNMSKKEILSLYLDRAYMGGGTFGAAAAAQFYFGKNLTDVTLSESAILAGLFKAPAKYAPHVNLPAARARANTVLSNLVQSGLMTEGQVIGARRNPATVIDRADVKAPDYFLDWAFDEVQRLAAEGKFKDHTVVVRTTIDTGLQQAAEQAMEMELREYGEGYRVKQGAMVMIENGGGVRAMVGGRDYGESQFNRATAALRQPGSSFKVYTYSAAMEKGMKPETLISDAPVTWRGWSPQNYGRSYAGKVTLQMALAKSYNTVPVRLAKDVLGTQVIVDTAKAMGVATPLRSDKTIPLGTSEVTVLDQATAYAVFPADGMQSRRHGIEQVMDYEGNVLYDFSHDEPPAKRVLSEDANSKMNQMLVTIPVMGTARRGALDNGIVSGGKTGTSQAYRDAWYVGFTGNYTTAVWFGNDEFTPMNNMTGGALPAMTYKRLMDYAHQGMELRPIPGIQNPLPTGARPQPSAEVASASASTPAMPALTRPRSLSAEATRVIRSIAKKMKDASALSVTTQKVADASLREGAEDAARR